MRLGYADMEAHPSTVYVGCVRQRRHNLAKSMVSAELGEKLRNSTHFFVVALEGPKLGG